MSCTRWSLGQLAKVAFIALVMLVTTRATTACSKNEEIVCGTTTENTGPTCAAEYTLCAGGNDRIDCKSGRRRHLRVHRERHHEEELPEQ